jgi:hypothetical protein
MDRRELLERLSGLGVGLAAAETARADHGGAKADLPAGPLQGIHLHFCGIHIAKKDPRFQLVAQHYCGGVHDELHQCLLFDSPAKNARLLGVEYIISDRLFRELPGAEKKYWHPHTYEVLAGGLIAPGMPAEEEGKFMKAILTTWGKTWHTWPDPQTALPVGEPLLMWALTGDGQADPAVIAARDKQFGASTTKVREKRIKDIGLQVPKVSLPKSLDQVGRQWTDAGEDRPTPAR